MIYLKYIVNDLGRSSKIRRLKCNAGDAVNAPKAILKFWVRQFNS